MFYNELVSPTSFCRVAWLVCAERKKLVGYTVFKIIVDEGHLHNVAVRDGYRNQGLGALLIRDMLSIACIKGVKTFLLEVRPSNFKAINLYEKFGFVKKGLRKNYYRETGEDAWIMGLELGGS